MRFTDVGQSLQQSHTTFRQEDLFGIHDQRWLSLT